VRTPVEREGDLTAQIGASHVGTRRLLEMVEKFGLRTVELLMRHLLDYSERLMR
jgi:N-methylhydantoinase B